MLVNFGGHRGDIIGIQYMGGFCGVGNILFLDLGGGFSNQWPEKFLVHFSVRILFQHSKGRNFDVLLLLFYI